MIYFLALLVNVCGKAIVVRCNVVFFVCGNTVAFALIVMFLFFHMWLVEGEGVDGKDFM